MKPSPKSSISLQDRDVALLRSLFESRIMTAGHAAALHFDGRAEATKKRLQRLKAAGHIAERPRRSFDPAVLYLTRTGLDELRVRGVLRHYPAFDLPALERRAQVSDITVRHELAVMDVKIALVRAISLLPRHTVAECTTWPLLNEFSVFLSGRADTALVKPDGFIRIHETEDDGGVSEHAFFLELDRSTETQEVLISRAACYLAHYKSGGYAERCGGKRTDYAHFPFRVLMVFKTAERRNNIAERLLQGTPPILTQVWLTTLADLTSDTLGAVWVRPLDYRAATQGTAFEIRPRPYGKAYERNAERDAHIEKTVQKSRLLE